MTQENMLPPHNREAEEALLGSLLIDPDAFLYIADTVTSDDFYNQLNGAIYQAIASKQERNEPVDVLTVQDAVKAATGNDVDLIYLINVVPTSVNVQDYAKIVREKSLRRRTIQAAGKVAKLAYDATGDIMAQLDEAEQLMMAVREHEAAEGIETPEQYALNYLDELERRSDNGSDLPGLSTGFTDLDGLLNGLQAPHQYILAARPGMGKSLFALNVADYASKHGKRVLFFSLEMSTRQIMDRRVAALTKIDAKRVQNFGQLNPDEQQQVRQAVGELSKRPLYIDASEALTPAKLRAKALRHYTQHGIDLIIIDHFHLMRPDRELKRSDLEWGEMSLSLAGLGKLINAPVLTLAQLNRGPELRQNKRPSLADLRESGRIEENAFAVMFLYRDDYYTELSDTPNQTEVIIAKHREGPTGTVRLFTKLEHSRFSNLAKVPVSL